MGSSDKWAARAGGIVCCLGLLIVLIGLIVAASQPSTEVAVWYSAPLCPDSTTFTTSTSLVKKQYWYTSPSACAATKPASTQVRILIPKSIFEPDVKYTTFTYTSDSLSLTAVARNGTSSTGAAHQAPGSQLTFSVGESSFSASEELAPSTSRRRLRNPEPAVQEQDSDVSTLAGPRRKLLKGSTGRSGTSYGSSYSSGVSYHSRSYSSYTYYGPHGVVGRRHARYGRGAVAGSTVVYVYSPSNRVYGSRAQASGSYESTSCSDRTNGCEYTVTEELTKTEWQRAFFTIPAGATGDLVLLVDANLEYAGDPAHYPQLFFSFASDELRGNSAASFVLALGFIIMCCCTPLVSMCMHRRAAGKGCCTSRGGSSTSRSTTSAQEFQALTPAATAASVAMESPMNPELMIGMYPALGGQYMNMRNGSLRNLYGLAGHAADLSTVDAVNNDIESFAGITQLPRLQVLNVENNNLTSLAGLSSSSLVSLSVANNDLTTLSGLHGATALRWFSAMNNNVSALPQVGLQYPPLTFLSLRANELRAADTIGALFPTLTHLDLSNNYIGSISTLYQCQQLQAVDLAGNCITDSSSIIALTHCPQLRFLDIRSNDMSAVHIQKVRDAFQGRLGFTLRS